MIFDILHFIKTKLESYLSEGRVMAEPLLTLANPWSSNDNKQSGNFLNAMTLINVEEEKIFKSQEQLSRPGKGGGLIKREPDIKLNLYVLISAYNKNYEDGLKFLSKVVGFFQRSPVFRRDMLDPQAGDDLPLNMEKIIVELYTAPFEQQSQIWASLSTGYVPSVIYKIRMIVVDTDLADRPEIPVIKDVQTNVVRIPDSVVSHKVVPEKPVDSTDT